MSIKITIEGSNGLDGVYELCEYGIVDLSTETSRSGVPYEQPGSAVTRQLKISAEYTEPTTGFRPYEEWHEDMGAVLWTRLPIQEPPYCGGPLDDDWPWDESTDLLVGLYWIPLSQEFSL